MTTKDTLKQWFKNGKKPDESQFSEWLESYWHKDEKIPIEIIENINNILANKSDTSLVKSLINQLEGKVDKEVIMSLEKYIKEIIDDNLNKASDKTYSIDKIQQIVEIINNKLETKSDASSLGILFEQLDTKVDKNVVQNLTNHLYGLIDDSQTSASDKTYSIDKIQEIINTCVKDAVIDIKYNDQTNKLLIQYQNGESQELIIKDNFLSEITYDPSHKEIKFILESGKTFTTNISDLQDIYRTTENGGIEIDSENQISIKKGGINESMFDEVVKEKINHTDTLQQITEKGNSTTKDLLINSASLGADSNGNIKFGTDALNSKNESTRNNLAIGSQALSKNVTCPDILAIGNHALKEFDGMGSESDWITSIGHNSATKLRNGANSLFTGHGAGQNLESCNFDTFMGALTGANAKKSVSNVLIGQAAAYSAQQLTDDTAIGHLALGKYKGVDYKSSTDSKPMTSGGNISIGKYASYKTLYGRENTFIGHQCGYDFSNYGEYNTYLGSGITKGYNQVYGNTSVVIGAYASLPMRFEFTNKLVIDAKRPEDPKRDPLVYGDFKEKWFKINGKHRLNYEYTPNADLNRDFKPSHMLVSDDEGNVGVTKYVDIAKATYSHEYEINDSEFSKICSFSFNQLNGRAFLNLLLDGIDANLNNSISTAYIRSSVINNSRVVKGLQENKTENVNYKLYYKKEFEKIDDYIFQPISQDNGTNFNLISKNYKDLYILKPKTGYNRYYIPMDKITNLDDENRYYTASMVVIPNEQDTQDTVFFHTIVLGGENGNNWNHRIGWKDFKKINNSDGSVFLYSTFLVERSSGRKLTEFTFICEHNSTQNQTKITNLKVEEGEKYTPYVENFNDYSNESNGVTFPIKGLPGSSLICIDDKYVHVAYADDSNGNGFSNTPEGKNFVGIYVDRISETNENPKLYTWSSVTDLLAVNDDVITIPCGEFEGKTQYLHVAYADNHKGDGFSTNNTKKFIGLLLDTNEVNQQFSLFLKSEDSDMKVQVSVLSLNEKMGKIDFIQDEKIDYDKFSTEFSVL